jgi:single-strand DNA-binding protein
MARSVNKVILLGNLGKDPEVRSFENGSSKASFTLATTDSYKDKNSGEMINQTEWHNIVAWRGLADIASKYLHKGDKIYVEGKLKSRSWTDQEGSTKYITEIEADNIIMMSRSEVSTGGTESAPNYNTSPIASTTAPQLSNSTDSDDLPF